MNLSAAARRIFVSVRDSGNVEIVAIVSIALFASIASLLDLVEPEIIASLTLAVLAMLASAILSLRRHINTVSMSLGETRQFVGPLPADFDDLLAGADRVTICGGALHAFMHTHGTEVRRMLLDGGSLRMAIADPDRDDLNNFVNDRLNPPISDAEDLSSSGKATLRLLQRIKQQQPHGDMEVRLLQTAPQYRVYIVEKAQEEARSWMLLYSYRPEFDDWKSMWVNLNNVNESWRKSIYSEVERMWEDGKPYEFTDALDAEDIV